MKTETTTGGKLISIQDVMRNLETAVTKNTEFLRTACILSVLMEVRKILPPAFCVGVEFHDKNKNLMTLTVDEPLLDGKPFVVADSVNVKELVDMLSDSISDTSGDNFRRLLDMKVPRKMDAGTRKVYKRCKRVKFVATMATAPGEKDGVVAAHYEKRKFRVSVWSDLPENMQAVMDGKLH